MKRRRYSAQRRPLYSTYFTTTRRNDMSCKNMNSDFTLFIHSCIFPRAARNKKSNCQQYQDSSRTICRNLTWSLEKLKRYRSCYIHIYYIYIWVMYIYYIYIIHICITIHATYITNYSSSFPFMGFWCPNKK